MADESEDPVLEMVKRIVGDELNIEPKDVTAELGLYRHPDWDSIAHAGILVRLEKEGGLALTDRIADDLTTVQQLADSIRASQ
jgi:acyl carrier protein